MITLKKYSWLSYISAGIPIILMILLLGVSNITEQSVVKGIFYALFLGAPVSIILSITALFRESEKNGAAVFGLSASLLLTGSLIYLLLLGFGMGEA
jgi:hypothetical protein